MSKKKQKYYVVWHGRLRGIYKSWSECQEQVDGVPGARYRSYETLDEAEKAFANEASAKRTIQANKTDQTRFYVVWHGRETGIFHDWGAALIQIDGMPGARYQTFGSRAMAERAWREGPEAFKGKNFKKVTDITDAAMKAVGKPITPSLSVDAASNSRTGQFEYRGVITETGIEVFRAGPFPDGSNNVGEFLAVVHGLAFLKSTGNPMPLYSDSRNAIGWVRAGKARSWVKNEKTLALLHRAEKWLAENKQTSQVLKWETKYWGESPADFGRK